MQTDAIINAVHAPTKQERLTNTEFLTAVNLGCKFEDQAIVMDCIKIRPCKRKCSVILFVKPWCNLLSWQKDKIYVKRYERKVLMFFLQPGGLSKFFSF